MNRRTFLTRGAALAAAIPAFAADDAPFSVAEFDRARVLRNAAKYLSDKPVTVTAAHSPRSAGGLHDFFSEGDYWWPDPKNPDGPYIQRDGMTNPDNFIGHRQVPHEASVQAPALTAAWKLTKDRRYADHAAAHIRAWFVDETTRMNPDLNTPRPSMARPPGAAPASSTPFIWWKLRAPFRSSPNAGSLTPADYSATRKWFADYALWMTTSKNGMEERDAKNNHGTCWLMQVAAFARLTGNRELMADCAARYKAIVVPGQLAPDGSQPLEAARTKPYGYCLFNLEALATLCQIVSESAAGVSSEDNLWQFSTPDHRGIAKAIEYMFPFIRDKKLWSKPPDVMYFEYWPMRQAALLFGGIACKRPEYIDLWKKLRADSDVEEVIRNYFIRQPVLWF